MDRIGSDRDPDRGLPIRVERDLGNFCLLELESIRNIAVNF